MVLLGLLLVAAAAVVGTEIVLSNTETVGGEAFNRSVDGLTTAEVFLIGAGVALALVVGLLMVVGGLTRIRARRAQLRGIRTERQDEIVRTERELTDVAEENERLRAELAEERRMRDTLGGVAVPPGDGTTYDTRTYDVTGPATDEAAAFDPYPGHVAQSTPAVEVEPERRRG